MRKLASFFVFLCVALPVAHAFATAPSRNRRMDVDGRAKHPHRMEASSAEDDVVGRDAAADDAMMPTYDKLAIRLIERYEKDVAAERLPNNQLFVCVAGGPGSGKSTLSEAVARRINEQMCSKLDSTPDGDELGFGDGDTSPTNGEADPPAPRAVVLPMDGFHYSRDELRAMGDDPAVPATYEDLLARRGAPWTFDAERCLNAFGFARTWGKGDFPTYCRARSDPVPGGVTLHLETNIVLVEGNYLLAWDAPRWEGFRAKEIFDETWYLACRSLEDQRERLVTRHLATWSEEKTRMWGEGRRGAEAKADANDVKNSEWIEEHSRKHADLIIDSL